MRQQTSRRAFRHFVTTRRFSSVRVHPGRCNPQNEGLGTCGPEAPELGGFKPFLWGCKLVDLKSRTAVTWGHGPDVEHSNAERKLRDEGWPRHGVEAKMSRPSVGANQRRQARLRAGQEAGVAIARVAGMLSHGGDHVPDLLGDLPQLCTCSAVRPGGGCASFRPEKEQIEAARYSAIGVGLPFPVTSPAKAEPAPTAATATAETAATNSDLMRNAPSVSPDRWWTPLGASTATE